MYKSELEALVNHRGEGAYRSQSPVTATGGESSFYIEPKFTERLDYIDNLFVSKLNELSIFRYQERHLHK